MAYAILWRFVPKAGHLEEFERHYGPEGTWAQFFRLSDRYIRTDLLMGNAARREYLTIDWWKSREDYEQFRALHSDEYPRLDSRFEELNEVEERIGEFEAIPSGG